MDIGADDIKPVSAPPDNKGRINWAGIAAKLRADPNVEYLIGLQIPVGAANRIWSGLNRHISYEQGFVLKTRNNKHDHPRKCDLYLTYVPDLDKAKPTE